MSFLRQTSCSTLASEINEVDEVHDTVSMYGIHYSEVKNVVCGYILCRAHLIETYLRIKENSSLYLDISYLS